MGAAAAAPAAAASKSAYTHTFLHSALLSEHLFQSLKFPHRPDLAKLVRRAETPSEAVRVARKHAADVRKGWRQEGLNVIAMREVL